MILEAWTWQVQSIKQIENREIKIFHKGFTNYLLDRQITYFKRQDTVKQQKQNLDPEPGQKCSWSGKKAKWGTWE